MNTEALAKTRIGKIFVRLMGSGMESRFRYRFFGPVNILEGVEPLAGKMVLELGCGTGFFTVPAAQIIGEQGCLVSMDILAESVAFVSKKAQAAGLKNVQVIKGDATNTQMAAGSFDTVLLFGVIPAPMIPMDRLLPEIQRILKPGGTLAVWPPVPGWLPQAVTQSGLFTQALKRNSVTNFRRNP